MADEYEKQMKQLDDELVFIQKDVAKCLEGFGKLSLGPGYQKVLQHRLFYIQMRFKAGDVTPQELAELKA